MEQIIFVLLSLWIVASILNQLSFFKDLLLKFNLLHFLPTWTYFAPKPINNDYRLLYRLKTQKGITNWREFEAFKEKKISAFFFNPRKRFQKIVITIYSRLLAETKLINHKSTLHVSDLVNCLPYKIALSIVTKNVIATEAVEAIQFMIISKNWLAQESKIDVKFVSQLHQQRKVDFDLINLLEL